MATKHTGPHVWLLRRSIGDYYCRYCMVLRALCGTVNCEDATTLEVM